MPSRLPPDLGQALHALTADETLTRAVGTEFCEQFLAIKGQEWQDYCQQVSAWEFQRYADAF
ncbi:MAG: hypothetical protein GW845_12960 [Rhodoferax sp.]|nr:hypothetical protein [Rhodoferax sp.]